MKIVKTEELYNNPFHSININNQKASSGFNKIEYIEDKANDEMSKLIQNFHEAFVIFFPQTLIL